MVETVTDMEDESSRKLLDFVYKIGQSYYNVASNKDQYELFEIDDNINDSRKCEIAKEKSNEENTLYSIWKQKLENVMHDDIFEDGFIPKSEYFVVETIDQWGDDGKIWIQKFFHECWAKGDSRSLIGILHIVSHIPYEIISSVGIGIALSGLSYKDPEVKEYAVKVFENWEETHLIPILENVNTGIEWLNDYIESVIRELMALKSNREIA